MRYRGAIFASILLSASTAPAATYLFNPPVAWPNENPGNTSGKITIYYDFRAQNGYANSIASDPAKLSIVQTVLADLTTVTGGQFIFAQDTNPADTSKIINIGVGDLAAIGGAGSETLGQGGATEYIPGVGSPYLGSGFAWLDVNQTWNTTLGNGNFADPNHAGFVKPDFYSVLFHELGHALGLGHSSSSSANIMTPIFAGQKQLPAQDDINGLRFLYPSSPTTTGNYDLITRSYTSGFHVFAGDGGQYNATVTPSGGATKFYYYTDAGTVNVTGTTDINYTTPYINPAYFEQQGGKWTQQNIQIGGASQGTYDLSNGTLTCPAIQVNNGGTFNMTGGTLNGTSFYTLGTTNLGGAQNWAIGSTFTVAGGTTTFSTDAGSAVSYHLPVTTVQGSAIFSTTQHLASLTVTSTSSSTVTLGSNSVLVLNALTVDTSSSAKLNLNDNDVLLHSSNVATDYANLYSLLQIGRNSGHSGLWTGNGITSAAASHSSPETYALALAINSQLPVPFNTTTHLFDGQAADGSTILIKYTYTGDANLDGIVDMHDYTLLDYSYLHGGVGLGGATGWVAGDFNYDGVVDYRDFVLADASLALHGSPLADSMAATHAVEFGEAYVDSLAAAMPEPASLALLLLGAVPLTRRRRSALPR